MPLRIEPNAEPVPGYRLIDRLGSGGFGEVWKAEAPGGLFKAIKFVQRGPVDSVIGAGEQDRSRAEQEWKSLLRVKSVRHPFIVLLDRFEYIEDYLVIVMELADRTLADRFKECRSQGLPGIPRDELLGYLIEAAEVLDLMNTQYQLQHLDIKPQNLFLVHNHVKVADFGLVKDTTSGVKLMTITGGVTPVYAAPETFDGKFSRQSDQYSLAIVYQEMLTGSRPFTGTSMKQLILQHLQNAYDLTPMPVNDRPILARALSKNPEDRFASCVELIEFLRKIGAATKSTSTSDSKLSAPPPPGSDKAGPSVLKTVGARGKAGPVKPVEPNFEVDKELLGPKPVAPAGDDANPSVLRTRMGAGKRKKPQLSSAHELPGLIQPSVIIGLGQLGIDTLTQLHQRLGIELGHDSSPHLRFLAIDTDPGAIQTAVNSQDRFPIRAQETFLARLQRPSHYLKTRDGKLPTDAWLNPKLLYRLPREQNGAGLRALGRLAYVDNVRAISRRIEAELLACCSQDTPHDYESDDLGVRSNQPRVYIASSLTGNTGSGMLLDVAYLVRRLLNQQGHRESEIVGLFYVPEVVPERVPLVAISNAHASLVELQQYSQSDAVFSAQYETVGGTPKGEGLMESGPAFQRCFLVTLPRPTGKVAQVENTPATSRVADFIFRDAATLLGRACDEERMAKEGPKSGAILGGTTMAAAGVFRVHWPRHAILEQTARRLCTQITTRWMSKDASALADTLRQWTHESWDSLGMRPENLIERFQQLQQHSLQQSPEQLLADILAPLHEVLSAQAKSPRVNVTPVVKGLDALEKLLGIPDDARTAKHLNTEPATIERALSDISNVIADECEQKLAELAVRLLEDPNYRLAGAEEALRQFCATVEQALQSQEVLAKELTDKASQLFKRIQQYVDKPLEAPTGSATHWIAGKRAPATKAAATTPTLSPMDLFELTRTYTKTRYHSLVLTHLNRLYVSLRGHLSDQIREVGFCRQRLGELQRILQPTAAAKDSVQTSARERTLFPSGCMDLKDTLAWIHQSITADDLLVLDDRIQGWIRLHAQALLQICMGSSAHVRNLAPAMLREAEEFLLERLRGASVAEMYLDQMERKHGAGADALILDDLEQCMNDACPELGRPVPANEISLITLPNDEFGRGLMQMMRQRVRQVRVVLTDRLDEMIFFQELMNMPWHELPQLGAVAKEIYDNRNAADPYALHSRQDVPAWQAEPAEL